MPRVETLYMQHLDILKGSGLTCVHALNEKDLNRFKYQPSIRFKKYDSQSLVNSLDKRDSLSYRPKEAAMSSLSATHFIEGLLERTDDVSRTIQSYRDHVPSLTTSFIATLSCLHEVLGRLIASPLFQSDFTRENNFDQTIFVIAVNRCGEELHEFLVQWAEVIKRNRGPQDEEYWSLFNTTVKRVTDAISVYAEAFQSCLTIGGR